MSRVSFHPDRLDWETVPSRLNFLDDCGSDCGSDCGKCDVCVSGEDS